MSGEGGAGAQPGPVRVTFLGTGSSSGVPGVGIGWGKCDPANPRNERSRQSVLVDIGGKTLLVDTTPDLRMQLLRAGVDAVDGVLYTHAHADHIHGIDDLRGINKFTKKVLPGWADPETHAQIEQRFDYALRPLSEKEKETKFFVRPAIAMSDFAPGDDIDVGGVRIETLQQDHGFSKTVGFKFGGVVYSTDVKTFTDDVLERLRAAEIDVWVIGVFRWDEHWTHAHVDLALEWIERVKPRRAVLTHLGPDIDYAALRDYVPAGVTPAFDGLTIEVDAPGGDIRITD